METRTKIKGGNVNMDVKLFLHVHNSIVRSMVSQKCWIAQHPVRVFYDLNCRDATALFEGISDG